jgi:hypothetical protein
MYILEMWSWLETSNLKITEVEEVKEVKEVKEVEVKEEVKEEVEEEVEEMPVLESDTPSDEDAEWEKDLDKKCNDRMVQLVFPRNHALIILFMYSMSMFIFISNTGNVCRS